MCVRVPAGFLNEIHENILKQIVSQLKLAHLARIFLVAPAERTTTVMTRPSNMTCNF